MIHISEAALLKLSCFFFYILMKKISIAQLSPTTYDV